MNLNDVSNYLFWCFTCGVFLYLLKRVYQHFRIWRMLIGTPGPKRNFLFGNLSDLRLSAETLHANTKKWSEEFYPHYTLRVFSYMSLHLLSPEDCEKFLEGKKHSSKSIIYGLLKNWLKDGLLLSYGTKWATRRRILTPAFHFGILKDFVHVFNEGTREVIEELMKHSNESIDIVPISYRYSLKSISETAMGYKLDSNSPNQKDYFESIIKLENLLRGRLMNPFLYNPSIWNCLSGSRTEKKLLKKLHNMTRKVIDERIEHFERIPDLDSNLENSDDDIYMGKKRKRLAMLDILLQAQMDEEEIDYEGICEEVDTFMFEGHDTTGAAISFCLMLIACNPIIQEQIHDEIRGILGNENREPNYYDLQKLELTERCIKESLRLYPSVHMISRSVDEDVVLNSGVVAPKGSYVLIEIFSIHRNPKIYPDPDKFDPDRFLPDNCRNRHPFAYIPFSAGPRNCIGQKFAMLEIKALLVGIVQRFILLPVDTPDSIVLRSDLILRTDGGIKVKFIPRSGNRIEN